MEQHKDRITIVAAADDRYAPLLYELIRSIRDKPQSAGIDISIISTGMSTSVAEVFRGLADNFTEGRWDMKVSESRVQGREWLKGRSAKLYLPDYFPDYDLYLWIDADAWVNDWRTVELMIEGCRNGDLAMAYDEVDTGYYPVQIRRRLGIIPSIHTYCLKHLRRARMPRALARQLAMARPLNGGVFALRADAPHWPVIQRHFEALTKRGRIFGSNQMAFVMAVRLDGLPLRLLPAWCNFMGEPLLNETSNQLLMPELPHDPVGIVHLANRDDIRLDPKARISLRDTSGQSHSCGLRYPMDPDSVPDGVKRLIYT